MRGAVTVHMNASAIDVWNLVSDVRNTGRFSPEVFDAEWLDGVDQPAGTDLVALDVTAEPRSDFVPHDRVALSAAAGIPGISA
jgi:Polyketide cyclase / dehydrase and lipid transport